MWEARLAVPAELGLVCGITDAAYSVYVESLGGRPLPMLEDYAPRIAAGEVWLVSRAGTEVGLAVLETAADHMMVFSLAVMPAAQGLGLGRWLLDFAAARARAAGVGSLRLYTNSLMVRNIRMYERAGFRETGRRPNERRPGWFFVDMERPV